MPVLSISSILVFLSIYTLVFFEGLFIFTRPGFRVPENFFEVAAALLVSGFFLALPCFVVSFLFSAIDFAILRYNGKKIYLRLIPAAVCLTVVALLLVDNFSYTVFKIGIMHAHGFFRIMYLAILAFLFYKIFRRLVTFTERPKLALQRRRIFVSTVLPLALGFAVFLVKCIAHPAHLAVQASSDARKTQSQLPNIIFFASDGTEADHLKLYGYGRNTTPKLAAFAKERPPLLCMNAISNGARTTGSVTALLTGKSPATTKVFFPPQILNGDDTLEHLPGILKNLGYTNFQETIRYYADAGDLNMQHSFDIANNRSLVVSQSLGSKFTIENYFLSLVVDRIRQRLLHLTGIRTMDNVFSQMTKNDAPSEVYGTSDTTRMQRFYDFVKKTRTPFFAHLHLLDAHCCTFQIRRPHFSRKKPQSDEKPSKRDLLDDSILDSDFHFGRMVEFLRSQSLLENTIIVYSSDHNRGWKVKNRIPLMFFFTQGQHARVAAENCQAIDVMPTVLDSLKQKIPSWAEGRSLLKVAESQENTAIFSFTEVQRRATKVGKSTVTTLKESGSPYFGLAAYQMVKCNQWYELDLKSGKMQSGKIAHHNGKCNQSQSDSNDEEGDEMLEETAEPILTNNEAKQAIISYLNEKHIKSQFQAEPKKKGPAKAGPR